MTTRVIASWDRSSTEVWGMETASRNVMSFQGAKRWETITTFLPEEAGTVRRTREAHWTNTVVMGSGLASQSGMKKVETEKYHNDVNGL